MLRGVVTLLFAAWAMLAQSTGTATIVGTVTDSTGARIPAAKVVVVNTETQFISSTATNADGDYYISYLNPGTYRLTIEAPGFRQHVRDGIVLRTSETPRLDVQLELGSVTETVKVTAAAPLLETETSATGQVLEGETIVKIPVLQKYAFRILLYLPGTTNINGQHVVGQRERSLGYTLDGIGGKEPVRSNFNTNQVTSTTIDALQEVKLFTTGMPAEYGHSGGGLLSTVFKSGTNQLHGSAEDRYINKEMIHRTRLEQLARKNPFTYHELSATLGGPVYFPKLYDGKNKTFFFFGFQRHHEKASETRAVDVPSDAMYAGDFSFGGRGRPLYDPNTTRQDESGRWIREPFAGNKIPTERIDPVIRNYLAKNPFTRANAPGFIDANGPHENLVTLTKYRSYRTRFDGKVDHQFSSNHKIFGRYSHVRHRSFQDRWTVELAWRDIDFRAVPIPIDQRNAVISDTFTLSPTIVNEMRFGFNRRHFTRNPPTIGQGWARQLGIPNTADDTFPDFRTSSGGRHYRMDSFAASEQVAEDFTFQENLTKVAGRHTIKTGYELLRTRFNSVLEENPSGIYRLGGTDLPFTPNTGNEFANFLLGYVVRADFTRNYASWLPRWWSHALYIQDDFKPTRNLTLNLGVRWSYESPFSTKYGQQAQFDPTARDPITGRLGAITHPGGPLARRDWNNFQPRLGLAWNFHPGKVFRASFGMISQDLLTNDINQNFDEYQATAVVQQPTGDPRPAFRLSQGPPPIVFRTNPDGSVPFIGTNFAGRSASWFDPNMRMPYIMNWSAGVQWEFARNILAELTYQGSAGVGLLNSWDINAIPLDISRDPAELQRIFQALQNYKPYPQFGAVRLYSNFGHNTYHGGTLRMEKRYSAGLSVNGFYTLSKALNEADNDGDATGVTYYNRRLEKARANYDIRHRFVSVLTYELPFGRGRRLMNRGGILNAALGGWELAWTETLQSGPPFTITFADSPYNYLPGALRPNQIRPNARVEGWDIGPNRFPTSAQNPYLDISAFAYPGPFQPGTLGRNTVEAPGLIWTQFSLSKSWAFFERARFILRWDVNNPFKNPAYGQPGNVFSTRNTAAFGRVGTSTRGGFSDIGTANFNSILVARIEF
ncbi:MAG TPA: carboxypeptidase regulatory-like domain-containing protein [Bryobacteraceae bacterium]|nr:carboxypeptidase regulatory-like domain-containing protein [Bryobacteraceae bacterium]